MTEQPADILRDAKGIQQALKELLKTKEPFDREVDFQRKTLRRRYLSLLLVHPYEKESKDVENHLWMQTSYAFITKYKKNILELDRAIQPRGSRQTPPQNQRQGYIVEHRKLKQRFRQFLADEEKFWTKLLVRLHQSFGLDEATPTLTTLGLLSETDTTLLHTLDSREGAVNASNGRNHFQFPPEDSSVSLTPKTASDRAGRLAILNKALICLGDIARYRELYNESGGRPKAGQEDLVPPRRGNNRRGSQALIDAIPRPRNYEKAQHCYEQARLLVPHDGNPSHQLAILASYYKDSFGSLVHYYRALCVRQPYETASDNLNSVLAKSLEQWRNRSRRERERTTAPDSLPPRVRVELFREKVVVLHALWKVGMDKGVKKMESIASTYHYGVFEDFFALVAERHLPIDMISSAIIISQGALWKHRMVRDPPNTSRNADTAPPPEGTSMTIEWRILDHLLDFHRALLEVGKDELGVPPPVDANENDLAQRITATFRRTLPALRIASKWLRANYKYVMQDLEFSVYQDLKRSEGVDVNKSATHQLSRFSFHTKRFWQTYSEFLRALFRTFPAHRLPALTAPLEEDIEMRGFLPLKKLMGEMRDTGDKSLKSPSQGEEVHPNDWQLMRIADLINDARELARIPDTPIKEYGGHIMFESSAVDNVAPQQRISQEGEAMMRDCEDHLLANIRDTHLDGADRDDDNMTELTSRTDDDVVRDAFRFLDTSTSAEEDEDEDEIVWDPRAPVSPVASPISHATPMTPAKPLGTPMGPSARSPTHPKAMSPFIASNMPPTVAPTTAHDLMNDVLSGRATGGALSHLKSSAPQPALLFGSELSHHHGQNIWSASQSEQSLKFTSQPNHTYQARQLQGPIAPEPPQSIWSSSYSHGPQNPQHSLVGALPSPPFIHQKPNVTAGTHQRVSSISGGQSQRFQSQPDHHDPFSYPASMGQHPPDYHGPVSSYMNPPLVPHNGSGMYYENPHIAGYQPRHPVNDPRIGQPFVPQSMSQVWGNVG